MIALVLTCLHLGAMDYTPQQMLRALQKNDIMHILRALKTDRQSKEVIDPDTGFTLQHCAAQRGLIRILEKCVQLGKIDAEDANLCTPLHIAAKAGQDATVLFLVNHQADVNAVDNAREIPLHKAVVAQSRASVQHLLRAHSNPDAQNAQGQTCLHLLTMVGDNALIARDLLTFGGSPVLRSRLCTYGDTIMQHAIFWGRLKIIKELLRTGLITIEVESCRQKASWQLAKKNNNVTVGRIIARYRLVRRLFKTIVPLEMASIIACFCVFQEFSDQMDDYRQEQQR